MNSHYLNEEEVKNNIIIPYLQDLGFSPEEVSFETSFSLKFGTSSHKVGGKTRKGYLDILCKKDTKNLFVLEIKREDLQITQDDIDQGVSYARLLDQIAPFVLVTNGKETIVVDSISKARMNGNRISSQSRFWKNNCNLSTDEDLKIRYEALKNFISLSLENFTIFTQGQVEKRIKPIVGGPENDKAKYIPEIYVPREGLYEEYELFLSSSSAIVFAVIGDAGVGKTNVICDLCLRTKEYAYALFYNGPLIFQSLVNEINQDFNMFFSASQSLEKVISDIKSIVERFRKPLVLFVDAIDEVQIANFKQELGNIVNAIQGTRYIKICLSCKSNLWEDFFNIGANVSYIKSNIYIPTGKAFINPDLPGVFLKPFSGDELSRIIPKYEVFFSTTGIISPLARRSVEVGLYLRIYYQSYQNKQMPSDNISFDFFESYLEYKATAGYINKDLIITMLSRIAKLIISKDSSDFYSNVTVIIDEVREALELRPTEEIPKMLFSQNLLLRSAEGENPIIAFYDSTIRDYVLIKYSYMLNRLSDSKFLEVLPEFFKGIIGQSAITFYMENADNVRFNLINRFIDKKRLEYIHTYSEIFNRYFHNIRNRFNPYTLDEIGLIIPRGPKKYAYALFPTKEIEIEKRIIEIDSSSFSFNNDEIFNKYRVHMIHYGPLPIFTDNLEQSIKNDLFEQLSDVIKEGRLEESINQLLLIEKVINTVYFYMKKLGYKIRTHNCPMPNYQDIYGLELAEIKEKIYIFFAEYYYEKKNVQDLIKSGKIVPHNGSLSYSSDQLDWDWVNAQVGYAIKNKPVIPMPQSGGDFPPFVFLLDCINSLLDKGYRKIGELEYLPIINNMVVKIDNSCNPPIYCLHEGSVRSIIETLFTKLDSAYKELVDFCFPSLKNDLDYYSKLPHQFFIYWKDSSEQFDTFFNYAYKQSENGKTNFKWINTPFTRNDFDEYGYETLYSVRLDDLLEPYSSRKMLKGINTTKVDRHLVLRELVYKALTADFKKYCKKNGIDVSHNFS